MTRTAVPTYELAASAIAQVPVEPRDAARLLVDGGPDRPTRHLHVRDLASLVGPGDLIVLNETKVLPARLRLQKLSGGSVEVLLLEDRGGGEWDALVRPGRRVPAGTELQAGNDLIVVVGADRGDGIRSVRLVTPDGLDPTEALSRHGEVPLPPYLHEGLADPGRYQTVYARSPGSVAAPTAGLHLTEEVLDRCRAAGASVATIDLAVGLGTFRPVTAGSVEDHEMHEERYAVPPATMAACREARRVVAVGTTSVRALEAAAASGELSGRTDLLIADGHQWQVVDALLTNFHQPASTLLCLIQSFVGLRWRALYEEALVEGYRFLSFGDAMFLERRGPGGS